MCGQCVAGAATAAAGATGIRVWLVAKAYSWMTPRRLRLASGMIVAGGVVAASVRF